MFIELTDHLRCPADHEEAYLVLLPRRMKSRNVVAGQLGCPVCGRTVEFDNAVVDFGGSPSPPPGSDTGLTPEAAHAFLGITGPGGYVALVGGATTLVTGLASLLPGVGLIAVNPPAPVPPDYPASALRAPRLPLKTSCLRGVILGPGLSDDWVRDAVRATLPGLRIVGEGTSVVLETLEIEGEAEGVWVGRKNVTGSRPPRTPAHRQPPTGG